MLKKYFGDKAFYRWVLAVAIPIIIQNGITTFVSLLDNIMVGQIGNDPMSGVSTVNNLLFVFNLTIFGATSGAGIFTAQFHGTKDNQGVQYTFRFKILICLLLGCLGIGIFALADQPLINLYLQGEGAAETAASVLAYGREYLSIMLWGLIPFALCGAYSSTLRETGQTVVPMIAGIIAVFVNLVLNFLLIFGHLGLPAMGIRGAALATVISRYVELAIVACWTHLHPDKNPFIRKAFASFYIPGKLFGSICVKGMPLLINEFLWSCGIAFMSQCYSTCGLAVVPALNIAATLQQLGNVVFQSMSNSVGILMGQILGAGRPETEVRDTNRKLITLSVLCGVFFGGIIALFAGGFPNLYNTTDEVRLLAAQLILVNAAAMPFCAYTSSTYFTLRSGGQTMVTFLFDCCFVWCICVPLAFCLSRFTDIPILPLFILCQCTELLKCILGGFMLKKGAWIQNLTHI